MQHPRDDPRSPARPRSDIPRAALTWLRMRRARLPRFPALRRVLALSLVAAAAFLAVRPDPGPETVPVLVSAVPLSAGAALAPTDVRVVQAPPALRPDGAFSSPAEAVGRVLTGAAARGEPLTPHRVVSAAGAAAAAGPGAAVVAVRPADPEVARLATAGSRVDVLLPPTDDGDRAEVVENAAVLTVRPGTEDAGPLLLLGLPAATAREVAAAGLRGPVAVTLR